MRTDGNLGGTPTYFPNSRGEWTDQPQLNEPPLEITGAAAHWDHRVDDDHWQKPGDLFRKTNPQQKQTLFENTARQVGAAAKHIQDRHVANCMKADPAYGEGVADSLAKFAAGNSDAPSGEPALAAANQDHGLAPFIPASQPSRGCFRTA